MGKLEIEYRDYKIEFVEHSDSWSCDAMSIRNEASLTAVKKKIDAWDLDTRRLGGIPVICVSWSSAKPTIAMTIADDKTVWCKTKDKREKLSVSDLVLDTPENRRLLSSADTLNKQAQELREQSDAMCKGIARITMGELRVAAGELLDAEAVA